MVPNLTRLMKTGGLLACVAFAACTRPAAVHVTGKRVTTPNGNAYTIGKETTVVDGPLRKDGTIGYVHAINEILSDGVTKDNNAAILLLQGTTNKLSRESNK